jgi:hypothetical protein
MKRNLWIIISVFFLAAFSVYVIVTSNNSTVTSGSTQQYADTSNIDAAITEVDKVDS